MTPGEVFLGQGVRESNFMDFCWDVWNQVFFMFGRAWMMVVKNFKIKG